MLYIILLIIVIIVGGYFSFCYISLIYAMRKIRKDIDDIQQDFTQNQIIHLPIPNKHLEKLLYSFNSALEEIRKERQQYEKREKEFQKQIENISHDLRTPLTVILGYLKIFKKSQTILLSNDKELSDTINIIEQKAEIMKSLVEQFYDYSRLKSDNYELVLNKVDVSRTLRESLMGNYQILEQAHLKIDINIPNHPIWILGEESALERIFLNLFQNVGRYANNLFQIMIKEQKNGVSILFINDTCILLEDDIPYLFDRFYIQNSSRNQVGTGLGLTIAKSLAEKMNGTLEVDLLKNSNNDDNKRVVICFELWLKSI